MEERLIEYKRLLNHHMVYAKSYRKVRMFKDAEYHYCAAHYLKILINELESLK